jgi:uncharacterized membrane protein YdfJ with MMPL/SSD domain
MAGGSKDKNANTATTKSPATVVSNAPKGTKQQLSAFLKKHSVALQQIAGDAKKTQRFETWLAKWNEGVEEGPTEKLAVIQKNRTAQLAAIQQNRDDLKAKMKQRRDDTRGVKEAPKPKMPKTRNHVASHAQSSGSGVHADQNKKKQPMRKDKHKKQLDFATESIKEMLYRKLNAKK